MEAQSHTICEYIELMCSGKLGSEKLTAHCLDAIDQTDGDIHAWIHLDREVTLNQARTCDDRRKRGLPLGRLHGMPVGVKDIFDTVDFPTECGSVIYKGRQPDRDSAAVERLKEAGAVILGKTVSTEFAFMHAAGTANPHNFEYSPGGSSSGSAAAVAAGQVPMALGTQTAGSVIRPASFCGVYGYKPSRGIISRRGVLQTSQSLDQVGVFGQDLEGVALLGEVLGGYDHLDSATYLEPRPRTLAGYRSEVPIEPTLVWFDMPYAERYSSSLAEGCDELLAHLGNQVDRIEAPKSFSGLMESQRIVHHYELYRCLADQRENHWDQLSPTMQAALEKAGNVSAEQYQDARGAMEAAGPWFDELFNDYDAILTPSALGEAPRIVEGTGDPICCVIWTLAGLPCISLPLLEGEAGLPMGVQLVGRHNEDDRLFRTARWLLGSLSS